MSTLAMQNVGLRIGSHWLLRQVSFDLTHGRIRALVGPNGSGKSTAIRLLAGLWSPTEGQIVLDSRSLHHLSQRELARRIALVPQQIALQFAFTVREVVAMGRYAHGRGFGGMHRHDEDVVDDALRRVDLLDLGDQLVTQLSGGERQRVILARCLATEADILLLDEPTSSLDLAHALDVLTLCRQLADAGRAVALAIHDVAAALRYADDIVVLHHGRLVAEGPAHDTLNPERIEQVFDVQARMLQGPDGETVFSFTRRAPNP